MKSNVLFILVTVILCVFVQACSFSDQNTKVKWPQQQGIFTLYNEKALQLLDTKAELKTLATGFEWVEGPVWIEEGSYVLFSDIPNNKVHRYDDINGLQTYLANSGFSNGLRLNQQNELYLMQSRSREVSKMKSSLTKPSDNYQVLASHYQGKRLNSPNDSALHSDGSLFFTDPPYGLPKQLDDPAKELDFQGVYRLSTNGDLTLIDKTLTFPNGIALSPDDKWLYVAVSDEKSPAWYRYALDEKGNVTAKELFYKPNVNAEGEVGAPDGLKVHSSGWVFATGTGGVWVFDENKTLLAHIKMPGFTANLAFDTKEKTLFLTAHHELRSLALK